MARPSKNYCDYFPHLRDMRNHKKIKAVRNKFGITGYAIWNLFLEYLTGNDGNEFEYSEIEFELMAGDFGVSATEITDVLNYCIKLELLFVKNNFVHSPSLDENLAPVYEKRQQAKQDSKKQLRLNGKFISETTDVPIVSVTEMPQIKLNKTKKDKRNNEDFNIFWEIYKKPVDKSKCLNKFNSLTAKEIEEIKIQLPSYIQSTLDVKYRKNPLTYLNGKCWNDGVLNFPTSPHVPDRNKVYQQYVPTEKDLD